MKKHLSTQTRKRMLSSIGLILFSVSFVLAQVLVKGTVKDNLGEGVPGASVQVKGTSQGTNGSAPDGPPPRSGAAGSARCPPGRARHRSGWQCICRWRSGRPTAPRRSGSGVLWAGYPAPRQGLRCLSNHKAISDTSNQ